MTARLLAWLRSNSRTTIHQVAVLISWVAIYLIVLLAVFATLIKVATGWGAVVVTSESMMPTLRPGDVMFIEEDVGAVLGQQSVITFRSTSDPDELITHRIFETLPSGEGYITKGDANPTVDTDVVSQNDVAGVGRLVVPYLGLPLFWVAEGNTTALAALVVLTLAALAAVISGSRRTRSERLDSLERFSPAAQRGINRVRLVVGAMITLQLIGGGGQFDLNTIGLTRVQTLLTALGGLAVIGLLSGLRSQSVSTKRAHRLATMELIGDTVVVVFVIAASGISGIGWILMALPIIEAAIHFRLTGAFVHWVVMSGMTVAAFLWTSSHNGTAHSVVLDDLDHLVDRLGVLLLVVIPGSYLAEQLLGDALTQRRATRFARERSQLIERVTEASRDVTRLGGNLFETLVNTAHDLGFDTADAWAGEATGPWKRLATAGDAELSLPAPGEAASALRPTDLLEAEVVIDADDPDEAALSALAELDAAILVRLTLVRRDEMYVVLRAALRHTGDDPTNHIMALRLLGGQASVALRNEQLLAELRTTHAELEYQALFDSLTGLANRAHFVGLLGDALRNDEHDDNRTTIMFLDLNGFKAVNDRYGHQAGDELLTQVASRLVTAIGTRGLVARLGGDEFTVLFRDVDAHVAGEYADAIHLALAQPFQVADDQARVGASIGIAHSEPFISVSEMLRQADMAMYSAKAMRGDWRTVVYHVDLDENERRSERMARDFRKALKSNRFHLAYQPVVQTSTASIVGVEALLRWTHPEFGPIPPPTIIELAEITDNVDALNAWVFERALVDIAGCPGDAEPFVAVNVSPHELELPTLTANMHAALTASGIEPSRVVVELSERIVATARGAIDNVTHLTDMGLRLALDDFGEGQTSLAHLRGLPITFLKLDRLFVQHAGESVEDRTILASVSNLAQDLGFIVIAEGVETPEHQIIVAEAGADLVQGYGLYRPMSVEALYTLLAAPTIEPGATMAAPGQPAVPAVPITPISAMASLTPLPAGALAASLAPPPPVAPPSPSGASGVPVSPGAPVFPPPVLRPQGVR